jgi:DNA-binding transcriptional MerR regulator
MLLKVGELARRTGLTVRTLHHYDEIGLLKPTGRSDGGYRLYGEADVQRLHSIQALRHLGLALNDIAGVLGGESARPEGILAQQIQALDQQIEQASELRGRLALLHEGLVAGTKPNLGNWLEALAMMATYGKYFSAAELRRIFENWKRIAPDWLPLQAAVRAAMDRGLPPDALQVQPLVHRWMSLMLHWMDGDFNLLERWGHMYNQEPSAHGRYDAPPSDMLAYMESAIQLRMSLLAKYLTIDELRRIGNVPRAQWDALEQDVATLVRAGASPAGEAARAAARRYRALMDEVASHDPALLAKLQQAAAQEPLLRAGSPLSEPVREFLLQVPREKTA